MTKKTNVIGTNMAQPKMTVIIPTRERCDVLEKALQTVTAQDYENLEIIVSDNFSSDATEQVVRAANDPRIIYINTGKRVSMSHNWEFALSFVLSRGTDGWVTIIGDDDGLMPGALSRVSDIVANTDVQSLRSIYSTYIWPSFEDHSRSTLLVPLGSDREIRVSTEWINRVIDGDALYTDLPMLYTGGWTKLEVIAELKRKAGNVYLSITPDVYSGFAIASVIDRYMYIYEPLAIGGSSINSTGRSFLSDRSKQGSASPYKRYSEEGNMAWHSDIPLCSDGSYPPSLQALVYESYLQTEILRPQISDSERNAQRARQLGLILANAKGPNRSLIVSWLKDYAERYEMEFEGVMSSSMKKTIFNPIRYIASKYRIATNYYITSGRRSDIVDVYKASLEADLIRRARPGPLEAIISKMRHRAEAN